MKYQNIRRFAAVIACAGLLGAAVLPAFAEEPGTAAVQAEDSMSAYYQTPGGTCQFNTYLVISRYASVPAETFRFSISPGAAREYSVDGQVFAVYAGDDASRVSGSPAVGTAVFKGNELTTGTTKAKEAGITLDGDSGFATVPVTVDFTAVTFRDAGIYRYMLTEADDGARGMSYDTQGVGSGTMTRYLDVYVSSYYGADTPTLQVSGYVLHADESDVKASASMGSGDVSADGDALTDKSAGFVNELTTYRADIVKQVSGNQASYSKYFKIDVTLNNGMPDSTIPIDLAGADAVVENGASTLADYVGQVNPSSVTLDENGSATVTFYLRADDNVEFQGLLPDTTISAAETAEDYLPSVRVLSYTATDEEIADTSGVMQTNTLQDTAVTQDTRISFVNTRDGVVPTGVAMPMAPYLAGGAAAAGICALLAVLRVKRMRKN